MAGKFVRSLLLALTALALAAPTAGASLGDYYVPDYDAADGVTIRASDGYRYMHFGPKAAKLYRGLAGKRAEVACGRITPDEGEGPIVAGGGFGSSNVKLPAKRGRIYLLDDSDDAELCTIATKHTKADRTCLPISSGDKDCARVIVAVTDSGRAFLAAQKSTIELELVPLLVGLRETMPAKVKAFYDKYIVTLGGPDASPPAGQVGYWTEGENFVVANLLPDGTRRFVSRQAGIYSTNVEQLMGGDDDAFTVFGF